MARPRRRVSAATPLLQRQWLWRMRRPLPLRCHCGPISARAAHGGGQCPWTSSSAEGRGRRGALSGMNRSSYPMKRDYSRWRPIHEQATEIVGEVYRAGGALMADRGLLRGVADEGGWWPEFSSNEEALEQTVRSIERARLRAGEDVAIAIDVAASQLACEGRYRLATDGIELTSGEFVDGLIGWCRRYPIISVEDPVGESDHAGMRAFTRAVSESVQVIGDDYLVTSARRIAEAARAEACNAVLLKPNQVGTL